MPENTELLQPTSCHMQLKPGGVGVKKNKRDMHEMHTHQLPGNWTPVLAVCAQPSDFLSEVVDLPLKTQTVIKVTPALTWPFIKACNIVTMWDGKFKKYHMPWNFLS